MVDDQVSIRQLIRAGLRSLGYIKISEAENGVEALEAMATDCPDAVLLDGNMPLLDGVGTLKSIRWDARFRHVPVVMLTGRADANFVRECRLLGVNGFVLKPFTVELLESRLSTCFAPAAATLPVIRTAPPRYH